MVTKFIFLQDFFGFSKNGQKKCPKLKTQNTFGKKKSLKYNKFPKLLKGIYYKEPFYLPFDAFVTRFIVLKLWGRGKLYTLFVTLDSSKTRLLSSQNVYYYYPPFFLLQFHKHVCLFV